MPDTSTQTPFSDCAAIILAAGKSTRMKSRLPKPLHPLCGRPLTGHVVEACRQAGIKRIIAVVGHEADAVKAGLGMGLEYALQVNQLGSGDAAKSAQPLMSGFTGALLVLAGDIPLLRAETIGLVLEHHHKTGAKATLLTAVLDDPTGYGRIIRCANNTVAKIVEEKDASDNEKSIHECNPSIYCFDAPALFAALGKITPANAQGEYYLTDVIAILSRQGDRVEAIPAKESCEVLGVNTRVELAEVGRIMRERILKELMLSGVSIIDPTATYVDITVKVGNDTVIEPNTHLIGNTFIGEECVIGPSTRILNSAIGSRSTVLSSQIDSSQVGDDVRIGPYSNIRPNCQVANRARVGDFVELKNTILHEKVSASHLSYLGDAEIGEFTNIGAGTITCNYDGVKKHHTVIGKRVFIGTHTTLVAPVTIGDDAFTAAASSICEDVPPDALAIARCRQTNKLEWAKNRRDNLTK